ncbi:hypothetical protein PV325_011403 [Microctonus aethiopoides]|uniref:Uncharacterized protein n=1 Tax=Microctonus aethiopoides TaxID=144406 RepID=A0AA39FWT9_9HYME|nr:hypothetical protein PV325_011403 [Microctonus aethiopoides]KAK0074900.1 hypothetical protein PV326_012077 [Microctonus aethiopoides]KAK0177133.1 hypothetical protein PV328_001212 [Microctonus aethiopoides]
MDRKSGQKSCSRADRKKKRRFLSNQFTVGEDNIYTSASAAKLKKFGDEEIIINKNFGIQNCIEINRRIVTAMRLLGATCLAVAIFNEGHLPILQIMELMGITVGTEAHTFVIRRNVVRIDRSKLRTPATSKEGRTARLAERTSQELAYEVEESPMYGSGIAD